MSFHESDFQSLVTRYLKAHAWASFPYELKMSNGGTVRFAAFQPQQLPALYRAKHGILHHKLTDASVGFKPFDGFVFKGSEAYVGLLFHAKKQRTTARKAGGYVTYFIDIDEVYRLKAIPGKKSITEKDAILYGKKIIL